MSRFPITGVTLAPTATDRRAICIAGGPSLTPEQIETVRNFPETFLVIGVNNAFQICDYLDVLYAADPDWWDRFAPDCPTGPRRMSTWVRADNAPDMANFRPRADVDYIRGASGAGFSNDPSEVVLGGNSGHHAIQIAMHYGCREVLLLGYDFGPLDGRAHWFGDYGEARFDRKSHWEQWKRPMIIGAKQAEARGVRVINCSQRSALKCFAKVPLDMALAGHYEELVNVS